ncbi:MAG TPA: SCO family protein [Rectinemataceae bacterium]|nr:SCO family protein [Rectinemataceae bacterium]
MSRGPRALPLALLLGFMAGAAAVAHTVPSQAAAAALASPLGFDERLGSRIALDASFTGEDGKAVSMAELVKTPVVLNFVYYRCKDQCNVLLTGIGLALRGLQGVPGVDYSVVTVSVNDREGPKDALEKKAIALASIERPFPPSAWRFLVGDDASIDALADSVGLSYVRHGDDFDHPLGLVIIAPGGKIVRYMNGSDFLPLDLSMSVLEASKGIVKPTVAKMLRFCFNYNPGSRQMRFDLMRVSGIVIGLLVASFAAYLVVSGRKQRSYRKGVR